MSGLIEQFHSIPDSHKTLIYGVVGAVTVYFFYKKVKKGIRNRSRKVVIHEKNWKKDTVYLYQFPRSSFIPNLSPFCLKIETFLRAFKIPCEIRNVTAARSQYGLVPFVELNGEQMADSQLIELKLRKHFNIEDLPPRDEAVARTVSRMVDNHTFPVMLKSKMVDHPENVSLIIDMFGLPAFVRFFLNGYFNRMFKKRVPLRIRSMLGGLFSDSDFLMLLNKDLSALRDLIGDNDYIIGNEITPVDCTVFAHLATLYYLPTENDTKHLISTEYKTIERYLNRVRDQTFGNEFTA